MAYPPGARSTASTCAIAAGATVAIVGHTGSGKSTLVQPDSAADRSRPQGSVLLDGIDLRELSPAELRRQIGFVPQETFLFSATLAENIAFGVESATEEEIRRAAELAGLAADIEAFPQRLRDHGRRARHHALRRPEAAHRDRPRASCAIRAS